MADKETAFTKFQKEVRDEFDSLKKLVKPTTEPKPDSNFKLLFEQNEGRLKKTEDKLSVIEKLFSDFKESMAPDSTDNFNWVDFFFSP